MSAEAIGLDGLTDPQREGARLMAAGYKQRDIAEAVCVDEATVSRWKRRPAFIALVQAIHAESNAELAARMAELVDKALDVCESLLEYRHDPNLKLRAAIAIINASGITRMTRAAQTAPGDASEASA